MVHQVLLEDDMNLSQGGLEAQMSSPYRRVAAVTLNWFKKNKHYICIDLAGWACRAEPWLEVSRALADLSWAKSLAGG